MTADAPYLDYLTSARDLVTSREDVRAAFVAFALEKNRRAEPYVQEAKIPKAAAAKARNARDLLDMPDIQVGLLTAAGISDKAAGHIQEEDKKEVVHRFIENYLEKAGSTFVEELVYRFLLTRGDSLGGSIRNLIGELAQRKVTNAILAVLTLAGVQYQWIPQNRRKWIAAPAKPEAIKGLGWHTERRALTMVFNLKVPIVGNNVDICIFDCDSADFSPGTNGTSAQPERYAALGELKGGLDPAGADEHWKTASAALDRIRNAFSRQDLFPQTFFVGAIIENTMADEIWGQLQEGRLSNAANLTNAGHMESLCRWLINL